MRVVVEVHLRVERQQVAFAGHDERVDLDQRRIGGLEGLVDRRHQLHGLAHGGPFEAQLERQLLRLERLEAGRRVDVLLEDELGRLFRDLLDLHAAGRAGHHDGPLGRAVDDEAEVQFAGDRQPLLHEHALDDLALGPGLVRHEVHADDRRRQPLDVVHRLGDLDAAAFAAAAGVDLGLDDDRQAQLLRHVHGLVGGERDVTARHRHAEPGEDGLPLVFVDFHGMSGVTGPR